MEYLDMYLSVWIIFDGVASMIWVDDKRWWNQAGRCVRILVGIIFLITATLNHFIIVD